MRRMLCVLIIAAIVLIGTVAATPVLPGEFYGSVYLNGNPAPAGTVIVAKVNGEPRGELTTTVAGLYGGPDNFNPRLIVSSSEEEVNAGNVTITFFVGGVQAFQVVPFKSGNSEKLDLLASGQAFDTVATTVIPTSYSSGGSSGSSSGGGGGGAETGSAPVVPVKSTTVTTPVTTGSSVYTTIDTSQTSPATTAIVTAEVTSTPAVTTVPATTKKAGVGPLSVVFLVASIIAVLCILDRAGYTKQRR
jgi:hypothetical protein